MASSGNQPGRSHSPVARSRRSLHLAGIPARLSDAMAHGFVSVDFDATFPSASPTVLICNRSTYDAVLASTPATNQLLQAVSEVKASMKTTMVDLTRYAPIVAPGRIPKRVPGEGILRLREHALALLTEMAATGGDVDEVTARSFAVRYAELRDSMALLRETFATTEDVFGMVQVLLVGMLNPLDVYDQAEVAVCA